MPTVHIFNKGIEGRNIFIDEGDYDTFQNYLKEYLNPQADRASLKKIFKVNGRSFSGVPHLPKNFHGKIELIASSLLPDHFHLILEEKEKGYVAKFMRSLCTRYSMYLNKKHQRSGPLFTGPYKSAQIEDDGQLEELKKFIQHDKNHSSSVLTETVVLEKVQENHAKANPNKKHGEEIPIHFRIPEIAVLTAGFLILVGIGVNNVNGSQTRASADVSNSPVSEVLSESTKSTTPEKITMVVVDMPGSLSYTNVRKDPSLNSPIIFEADNGRSFELLGVDSGWYKVKISEEGVGYISAKNSYLLESNNNE